MEILERDLGNFWVETAHFDSITSRQTAASVMAAFRRAGGDVWRIGIEPSFLPIDAYQVRRDGLPGATFPSATFPLELLRAIKPPCELATLEDASVKVVASMLATVGSHGAGVTKAEIADALRQEEIGPCVAFDVCLVAMGRSFNRAPSGQAWQVGEVISLDSGGNIGEYIGDSCRMAILGEPDAELDDLLGEIDAVQMVARAAVRGGAPGGDVFAAAGTVLERSPHRGTIDFAAHGTGIVNHEAPWLTDRAPVPYAAYHADRPLKLGMVLSIETTLPHPRRGFIKLEDTVAVTDTGCRGFGDDGRGWNRGRD